MTDKEEKATERFYKFVVKNDVSNEFLVEIIKLSGNFLNLRTISDYARENNLSYQGVKTSRTIQKIFNVKFVIDNK